MIVDDRTRTVGKVTSVQSDKFTVELLRGTDNFNVTGFDDFHYIARIGSFLLVPVGDSYVVTEVIGLREKENSSIHSQDVSGLDKSSSAKYLEVVPVGMLPQDAKETFKFGVSTFPSLYADALYVLDSELDRILETANSTEIAVDKDGKLPTPENASRFRALTIGKSIVFEGYDVKIKVDDFFGGHSAFLGNTGSGKSCTISSILQSLFGKSDDFFALGATFVIFDVNGEYYDALGQLTDHGIGVEQKILDGNCGNGSFILPHWFLDLSEWELLLQASEKTQIPVLRTALGLTTLLKQTTEASQKVKQHFVAKCLAECFASGESSIASMQRAQTLLQKYGTEALDYKTLSKYGPNRFGNFEQASGLQHFLEEIKLFILDDITLPSYRNLPFSFCDLEEAFDFAMLYEEAHGNRQIRDYCSQMLTRFKSLRDNDEFQFLKIEPDADYVPDEKHFLMEILGLVKDGPKKINKEHQIIIINMNAVSDEVVELVAAVVSRMIFKILRHAHPRNKFPVHLLLEEAHRYISDKPSKYSIDAGRVFERIAKEGRKYGIFLSVASQRPSELSKTVLSQCSNFIVHRIQNPDDLNHIRQMTPFISDAVLKRLPSLPKQHALIFGNAVSLPVSFKVRDANPLPASENARIRHLWFKAWDTELELTL